MQWQYWPYFVPLVMAAIVSLSLAMIAWRRRAVPGAAPLAWLMLAVAGWSLTYAAELAAVDFSAKYFWVRAEYPGIVTLPVAWLILVLRYTGRAGWLRRRHVALLMVIPAVTMMLAWTNPAHGLIWREVRLDTSGSLPLLDLTYGLWAWFHMAYSYFLSFTGVVLIFQAHARGESFYRQQASILLLGVLLPLLGNVLYVFDLSPAPNLDLGPFAFTLTGLVVAWGLFRFRLLDLAPVARDAVIESMADGVIVLDTKNRVVDLNPAAARIIDRSPSEIIGQPAVRMFTYRFDLFERYRDVAQAREEITQGQGEAQRTYDLHISPLHDRRGLATGRLIVLRDVTERVRARAALRRQAEELQALQETVLDITAARELSSLLETIVERASRLLDAPIGGLYLCQPEGVRCVVSRNTRHDYRGITLGYGEGAAGRVAQTGEPLMIQDYCNWEGRALVFQDETSLRATLVAPLIWQEQVLGVIDLVRSEEGRYFSAADLNLLTLLANHAAVAVRNARLYEQAQREIAERVQTEAALRRSEQRLRAFAQALPDLAFVIDENGQHLEVLTSQEHLLYVDAAQMKGRSLHQVLPADRADRILEAVRRTIQTGEPQVLEYDLDVPKGHVWFEGRAAPMPTPPGEPHAVVWVARDVTERVQAEQALRDSEERNRALSEASFEAIFFSDRGVCTEANRSASDMFGYTHDELIGRFGTDVIAEESRELVEHNMLSGYEKSYRAVARRQDGATFPAEFQGRMYRYKDKNVRVTAVRDLTEQVQVEESLRERERFLTALSDITRAALETSDVRSLMQTLADRLGELFGADGAYLVLWDEATQMPLPAAAFGSMRQIYPTFRVEPGEATLTAAVLATGRPLAVEDVFDTPHLSRRIAGRFPIHSQLALPLIVGERKLGAALIAFNEPHHFTDQEISRGEQVAAQIALAVAKARALEEAQTRLREAETLRRAGEVVTASLSLDETLARLLIQLEEVVPYDSASVQLLRPGYTEIVAARGHPDVDAVLGLCFPVPDDNPNTAVVESGQPVILADAPAAHPPFRDAPHGHIRSWLGVPLMIGQRVIGLVTLDSIESVHFGQEHVHLAIPFANQAAVAIENARLHTELQKRFQEQVTLREAGAVISSTLDLPTVLRHIAEQIGRAVDATSAYICSYEPETVSSMVLAEYYSPQACKDEQSSDLSVIYPLQDEAEFVALMQAGRYDYSHIEDPALSEAERAHMQQYGAQAILYVPLKTRGELIGFIELWESRWAREFTAEEIHLCHGVAQQAALAIENARLYEEARAQLKLARTLQEVGALLTAQMSLEEVFERLFDLLAGVVSFDSASIFVPTGDNRAQMVAQRGFDDVAAVLEFVAGLEWKVLANRWGRKSVVLIPDTHKAEGWFVAPGVEHIRAHVGASLVVQGRLIGELNVDSATVNAYGAATMDTVAAFANQAAVAIENARLHGEIQAYTEELEQRVAARTIELHAEREKVEAILHSVGDAIAMTDLEMRIRYVNQAFITLTGYTADEALGRRANELLGGHMAEQDRQIARLALAEGQPWQTELTIRRKDGRTYEAAMSNAPMHDAEGKLVGFVTSHRDISRQKELDRARERFMANVSHQLRTPVSNIKLYAQLLQMGRRPERTGHYLSVLVEQSDRLTELVQDMLTMTEIDCGRAILAWERLSLPGLVRDTVTRFQGRAQTAGLILTNEPLPPDLPLVMGDVERLSQALGELVENALVFSPAGSEIVIDVRTVRREDHDWLALSVRDNGPGISPEEQEKVFDRFFRGALAESGHVPGTGLGLSIVQEIMRAHGGQVTVESVEGQGCTFTLWLRGET
ncbi:MAG: histidine kinase N-terminal 7TM domain-containing protein [Chloroflexota bacterium]